MLIHRLITSNGISNKIRLGALSNRGPWTCGARSRAAGGAPRGIMTPHMKQLGADLLALLGKHGENR
jgi:hypothetical protein